MTDAEKIAEALAVLRGDAPDDERVQAAVAVLDPRPQLTWGGRMLLVASGLAGVRTAEVAALAWFLTETAERWPIGVEPDENTSLFRLVTRLENLR